MYRDGFCRNGPKQRWKPVCSCYIQDYLTKWPEVYAIPDRKAETVAKCLLDITWRHGVPSRIIHDRAAEFMAEVLQETASLLGVTLCTAE